MPRILPQLTHFTGVAQINLCLRPIIRLFTISVTHRFNFSRLNMYANLMVKNKFDDETFLLFRSFENHASVFNSSLLQNRKVADDLAVARMNIMWDFPHTGQLLISWIQAKRRQRCPQVTLLISNLLVSYIWSGLTICKQTRT